MKAVNMCSGPLLMLFFFSMLLCFIAPVTGAGACDRCTRIKIRDTGGGSSAVASPGPPSAEKVLLRKASEKEIGKTRTCLVTGEAFVVTRDTEVAEYRGATCGFCSSACLARFRESPGKYVKI